MSHELKKHVGAVHVKGKLSLLQRKIANVLLLNAYEELPDERKPEHVIHLKTLAEAAGFDSNDTETLRAALEALVDTKIKWNILDRDGEEEWGVTAFLSQAVTKSGTCRYAYPPELRRKLYNPEIYARINLSVQERFGSSYSLALYENCVRFRKVGTTGFITLEQWRDLLGLDDGQYEEFKYLNRDVLKPAIKEVNRFSDILIKMETKREGRRVVALKFTVQDNPQLKLELRLPGNKALRTLSGSGLPDQRALAPEPEQLLDSLQRRLVDFGLTEAQALDISTEFDRRRIEKNLDYVQGELERGRAIKNVPAYTLQAIRSDYASGSSLPETKIEREVKRRRKARREQEKGLHTEGGQERPQQSRSLSEREERLRRQEQERMARLNALWEGLSMDERSRIEQQAVARMKKEIPFVYGMYERERAKGRGGEDLSITVRSTLRAFIYEVLEEEQP
ncbi:MAG: RepB family plasmid replication initiator protein [Bacteroidetes bacterium]|nr:MAG: RepB family plasmid replication initiator protein [Bacteroidota bacterium]